jgi:1,4-alpha-glucan branching enzyme
MPPPKHAFSNNGQIEKRLGRLLESDPYLNPYAKIIGRRLAKIAATETRLTGGKMTLADFASGH